MNQTRPDRTSSTTVLHCAPSVSNAQVRLSAPAFLVEHAFLWRGPAQHEPCSHVQWSTARFEDAPAGSSTSQVEHKAQRLVNGPHLVWADHSLAR
jgi:hypothetical protein